MNRAIASQIVEELLEATPERKDEIVRSMQARGADFIEHAAFGDYDLVLWRYNKPLLYAVSLNSGQEDPTTVLGQEAKTIPRKALRDWDNMVSQLRKWVQAHGKLLIGSTHRERTAQYRRLMNRYFLTAEWTNHPEAGFFILPD